ncbi:uncharacterized protein LOC107403474 [Ziziphus jujuba]|uniref:Uncharacterized protein LOC107403474 n=1 Tax=Ziziphus jujuba TaxID=326968 RepID=A0A6P3YUJ9_ZIZJJ|nr:uncharacterized protein LOC107403474 [Ziziphus jujuba]
MDPIKLKKLQALNEYKNHKKPNNLFLYSLSALTCSLFCSSPLWLPSLFSSMKVFLNDNSPKIFSLFYSSKFVFIVGNLIVAALIGESKMFSYSNSSPASENYYDEYMSRSRKLQKSLDIEVKREKILEKYFEEKKDITMKKEEETKGKRMEDLDEDDGDDDGLILPTEELRKRADDYIARVTKQRMFEARQFPRDGEVKNINPFKYPGSIW